MYYTNITVTWALVLVLLHIYGEYEKRQKTHQYLLVLGKGAWVRENSILVGYQEVTVIYGDYRNRYQTISDVCTIQSHVIRLWSLRYSATRTGTRKKNA